MQKELQDALSILDSSASLATIPDSLESTDGSIHINETESLLNRCKDVVDQSDKPILRIIHHLACSGGTLISKCISALPNTYLLSEVHPNTKLHIQDGKPKFSPSDVTTLARFANIPNVDDMAWKIFISNIKIAYTHIEQLGGFLVLREHSHSDYCVGEKFKSRSPIIEHLQDDFHVCSVATVRHPIDCFASMRLRNWLHFSPPTFDEYCARYLAFIEQFSPSQLIKYEDFVENSEMELKSITKLLDLPFTTSYADIFSLFNVTGDSGRGGSVIETKPRRELDDELLTEIHSSKSYKLLIQKLEYNDVVS
jgi:hypothetical protein